jgi:competence protein ComGC
VITIVEILIFVSAMFIVGYPIFKRQEARVKDQGNEVLDELVHKKEVVYTSIKDLDFDYRTGKLSEDDYKELKERYELEALHILKDIDDSEKGKTIAADTATRQVARESAEPIDDKDFIFCPKCGTKAKIGDNFCFKCGSKLPNLNSTQ